MIDQKLTQQQQQEILNALFGFTFLDDVPYDSEGEEFFADPNNDKYDFGTLRGIFRYHGDFHKRLGAEDLLFKLKDLLGI